MANGISGNNNIQQLFQQYGVKPSGNPDKDLEALGMTKDQAQSIFGAPTQPQNSGSNENVDLNDLSDFADIMNELSGDPDKDLEKLGLSKEEAQAKYGDPKLSDDSKKFGIEDLTGDPAADLQNYINQKKEQGVEITEEQAKKELQEMFGEPDQNGPKVNGANGANGTNAADSSENTAPTDEDVEGLTQEQKDAVRKNRVPSQIVKEGVNAIMQFIRGLNPSNNYSNN